MTSETVELHLLVNRLFISLDERRYDELAGLFAADGVWHRQGKGLQGPAGIRSALEGRPRDLTTRHLVTNFVADITGPDSAESLQYVTVYAHEGELSDGTAPIGHPVQIGVYRARFARLQKWQLVELSGTPVFRKAHG
jgi:hypothetical protein